MFCVFIEETCHRSSLHRARMQAWDDSKLSSSRINDSQSQYGGEGVRNYDISIEMISRVRNTSCRLTSLIICTLKENQRCLIWWNFHMAKRSHSRAVATSLASLIAAIKNQSPSVMKVRGFTRIAKETRFIPGEQHTSLQHLAKSQSLHSNPINRKRRRRKKNYSKAKSQTQKGGSSTEREENNTNV